MGNRIERWVSFGLVVVYLLQLFDCLMEKSHTQIPDEKKAHKMCWFTVFSKLTIGSTVNFYLQATFFLKACSSHLKKWPPLDHEQNIEVEGISTWKPFAQASHQNPIMAILVWFFSKRCFLSDSIPTFWSTALALPALKNPGVRLLTRESMQLQLLGKSIHVSSDSSNPLHCDVQNPPSRASKTCRTFKDNLRGYRRLQARGCKHAHRKKTKTRMEWTSSCL